MHSTHDVMRLRDHPYQQAEREKWFLRRALERAESVNRELHEELATTKRELNAERQRYLRICNET